MQRWFLENFAHRYTVGLLNVIENGESETKKGSFGNHFLVVLMSVTKKLILYHYCGLMIL